MKRKCTQITLNKFIGRVQRVKITENQQSSLKSEFVECPICSKHVLLKLINFHLDSSCDAVESAILNDSSDSSSTTFSILNTNSSILTIELQKFSNIPGLYIIRNFISIEEEEKLVKYLDEDNCNNWKLSYVNGCSFTKKWGIITDYTLRSTRPHDVSKNEFPLPSYLEFIIDRIYQIKRMGCRPLIENDFKINEGNAMSYFKSKGHVLTAHYDDRYLSGPVLINLSLVSDAVMTYSGKKGDEVRVPIPRRCVQIVAREARFNYTHEIKTEDISQERRVSVVLRQVGAKN